MMQYPPGSTPDLVHTFREIERRADAALRRIKAGEATVGTSQLALIRSAARDAQRHAQAYTDGIANECYSNQVKP